MNRTEIEEAIRSLFTALKQDKVESLLVHHSDWGINVRMFLNGDIFELDLIENCNGYKVEIANSEGKPPAQIDELSKLTQLLQLL